MPPQDLTVPSSPTGSGYKTAGSAVGSMTPPNNHPASVEATWNNPYSAASYSSGYAPMPTLYDYHSQYCPHYGGWDIHGTPVTCMQYPSIYPHRILSTRPTDTSRRRSQHMLSRRPCRPRRNHNSAPHSSALVFTLLKALAMGAPKTARVEARRAAFLAGNVTKSVSNTRGKSVHSRVCHIAATRNFHRF